MNAILSDTIPGIQVIKTFTGERQEVERFKNKGLELFEEHISAARLGSIFLPLIPFFMALGGVVIWGLGGYWVITQPDRLSVGMLVAFIGYFWRFHEPIRFIAHLTDRLEQAVTAAERVFEVMDKTT